ncbi:MAG: hypothetical protein A2020_01610 [Lentisphaerae bacterium GWF2_45_14]|nr:MAG: hypothetical protein A2020_01610 [Lentisphaerae bacterium GWF2_45_14]
MKTMAENSRMARTAAALILFASAVFLQSCVSRQIHMHQELLAKQRFNESILLFPPLSSDSRLNSLINDMGKYYNTEIPKRMKGQVIYAQNIEAFEQQNNVRAWNGLMKNGSINIDEAAAMGRTLGTKSVLTCQILEVNQYPPFRMVVKLNWIDTDTATSIGSLYQDVDLSDSETNYRYRNFAGGGLVAQAYEQVFYSEDKYQTAYLMPQEFYRFVAAFTTEVLFGQTKEYPWWWFWRSVG